jgi:uncharacterized protein (TIGR02118 family)
VIRVLVCYGRPEDPEAFDRHYFDVHVPLASALPGLREFRVSLGQIAVGGERADTEGPYLIASLAWDSAEEHEASLASPEGRATTADLDNFATGGWWLWQYEEQPAGDRVAG